MEYELVDEQDWAIAQILDNPVLFRDFINLDNPDPAWTPIEDHERAWTACSANHVSMCCGRSVHKTTAMIEMLYYWMINRDFIPGDPGLFVVVPNKAQKDLTFPRIRSACTIHWLINKFVDPNKINVSEGRIDFSNGFTFIMRIAGASGSEANVIGLHTFRIWVDEAQDFPWKTWQSLQNSLKFEIPGHKMIVSGVPNGERKDNVLYTCDQLDDQYVCFNIAQTMMSWWTPEIEYKRRKEYSAVQEDSEEYKHFVLGQHGVPTFAIFDRVRFLKEDYEVMRLVLTQSMFDAHKSMNSKGEWEYHLEEVIPAPPVPFGAGVKPTIGVGYDVGYSPDPAVFFIMYQDANTSVWRNLARIVLQRVEYALQRQTLMWLDRVYNGFDFIGIDMGGPGKVQYQDLTSEFAPIEIRQHDFARRLHPVEFGGYIPVAIQTSEGEVIEKKDMVKRVAVETVSRWVQETHKFAFAREDDNLMDELERTKFTRSPSGEPVYKTVDDHQFSAMMCAIMACEDRFGVPLMAPKIEIRPKLFKAKWLESLTVGARW
jgi:hypothetical protein